MSDSIVKQMKKRKVGEKRIVGCGGCLSKKKQFIEKLEKLENIEIEVIKKDLNK